MEHENPIFDLETAHNRLTYGIAILIAIGDALSNSLRDPAEYAGALWGVHDYLNGISEEMIECILAAHKQQSCAASAASV